MAKLYHRQAEEIMIEKVYRQDSMEENQECLAIHRYRKRGETAVFIPQKNISLIHYSEALHSLHFPECIAHMPLDSSSEVFLCGEERLFRTFTVVRADKPIAVKKKPLKGPGG